MNFIRNVQRAGSQQKDENKKDEGPVKKIKKKPEKKTFFFQNLTSKNNHTEFRATLTIYLRREKVKTAKKNC